MHRTEALHNDSGLFTDGPPGTNIEQNWCNAVQEEIAYVIEQAGLTLNTAGTESRIQLHDAINTMIVGAGGAGSLQAIDCNMNANKEIIPTIDGANNFYIGTVAKTFALVQIRGVDAYLRADSNITIESDAAVIMEGVTNVAVYSSNDGAADGYFGKDNHSFDKIYMDCDNEFDIVCGDWDVNATGKITIDTPGEYEINCATFDINNTAAFWDVTGKIDTTCSEYEMNAGIFDINNTAAVWDVVNAIEITCGADMTLAIGGDIVLPQSTNIHANQGAASENRDLYLGTAGFKWQNVLAYTSGDVDFHSDGTIILRADNLDFGGNGSLVGISDTLLFYERGSDPAKPAEGTGIIWMSDGTTALAGVADGDLVSASTVGGATKFNIPHDYSAGGAWV